jgi:hypothetical protein
MRVGVTANELERMRDVCSGFNTTSGGRASGMIGSCS